MVTCINNIMSAVLEINFCTKFHVNVVDSCRNVSSPSFLNPGTMSTNVAMPSLWGSGRWVLKWCPRVSRWWARYMQLLCWMAARWGNLSRFSLDGLAEEQETTIYTFMGNVLVWSAMCHSYMTEAFLLVVRWYNIVEQLEDVSYSVEKLQRTERNKIAI